MSEHSTADEHGMSHVMSPAMLIGTFLVLVALTVLTVATSYFPLGEFELFVAMGIASVKATLVAVYFMHLRYDKPINALLLIFSLAFVGLFIYSALVDSVNYQDEIRAAADQP